nr:MAG TPA: hypothetical protein [Caudoviricetes sp.]
MLYLNSVQISKYYFYSLLTNTYCNVILSMRIVHQLSKY